MNNTCCKDCTNRVIGCHEHCEKYAEFCKEREKQKELIRKGKEQNQVTTYRTNRYY